MNAIAQKFLKHNESIRNEGTRSVWNTNTQSSVPPMSTLSRKRNEVSRTCATDFVMEIIDKRKLYSVESTNLDIQLQHLCVFKSRL